MSIGAGGGDPLDSPRFERALKEAKVNPLLRVCCVARVCALGPGHHATRWL
jgi:hypothetical protein